MPHCDADIALAIDPKPNAPQMLCQAAATAREQATAAVEEAAMRTAELEVELKFSQACSAYFRDSAV